MWGWAVLGEFVIKLSNIWLLLYYMEVGFVVFLNINFSVVAGLRVVQPHFRANFPDCSAEMTRLF